MITQVLDDIVFTSQKLTINTDNTYITMSVQYSKRQTNLQNSLTEVEN